MQFVRTLGWLACVVYSTVPLFWLMVHPRAHRWREKQRSPFRFLVPAWITMWVGIGLLTGPWCRVALYSSLWTWIPAAVLLASGISLYLGSGTHFSWAQLGGLPEVRSDHRDDRLITTGIRARVRHPVYLAHLCEMLAWSIGTGLLVCWVLTAFAIATGAVMIRMEDAELEKRFGNQFRKYQDSVPAVLPRLAGLTGQRPRISVDSTTVRYDSSKSTSWQIPVGSLICVAEYTTDAGPYIDDYFLVFGTRDGVWYEASFYSDGCQEAVDGLGAALDAALLLTLVGSTDFTSRIIWPKELEGQPLFVDKKLNPHVNRLTESRQL